MIGSHEARPASEREFIGYGPDAPPVTWPHGAHVAISVVVNFEEGAELTPLYGDGEIDSMSEAFTAPQAIRDLRNESHFSYGTRRGFWRLLDVFGEHGVHVSFNACGAALERSPDLARAITSHGHDVLAHGYRWRSARGLTRDEERADIHRAADAIVRTTGQTPLGWNTRGGATPNTRELLVELGGFVYDSESYADDLPYFVQVGGRRWLTIPYSLDLNDTKLWRAPGHDEPSEFYGNLTQAFDFLYEEGAPRLISVGLHMRHSGRPAAAKAINDFLAYASRRAGVWIARRGDIARWWLDEYSDLPVMAS